MMQVIVLVLVLYIQEPGSGIKESIRHSFLPPGSTLESCVVRDLPAALRRVMKEEIKLLAAPPRGYCMSMTVRNKGRST